MSKKHSTKHQITIKKLFYLYQFVLNDINIIELMVYN